MTFAGFTTESEGSPGDLVGNGNDAEEETEEVEAATKSEDCPGDLVGNGNHAEEETEEVEAAAESEDCPNDLDGKTQGGNHAEEEKTEEPVAATYSWPSLCRRHAPDEVEDDGSESTNGKISCLTGDLPKYDASDDEEDGDVAVFEEGDRVKGLDTGKGGAKDSAGRPVDAERVNRCCLLFLSLLLMVAMPFVVWRLFGQPLLLVWRLSLLLCSCCAIWTGLLAVTLAAQIVILRIALVFALALYVDAVLEPNIGMLMVHLNSQFAASMMGYALAERRQHEGTELSATTVCMPSDEKKANTLFCAQVIGGAYFGLITLVFAVGLGWLVCNAANYATEDLVMCVSISLSCVLVMWIIYVGSMLLQGALIGEGRFCLLITYLVYMTMFYALFAMTLGGIWAMILTWPLMMGLSGLFGYCICVHATFKLRMKLGLPPVKKNESKEGSSLTMLLEKQGHGSEDQHSGNNNVSNSSFSTREAASVKPKIA